jgi:hypothetical protein
MLSRFDSSRSELPMPRYLSARRLQGPRRSDIATKRTFTMLLNQAGT